MEVELKELNLDNMIDEKGIRYIGSALKRPNGQWVCLADVEGCLCLVEVRLRLIAKATPLLALALLVLSGCAAPPAPRAVASAPPAAAAHSPPAAPDPHRAAAERACRNVASLFCSYGYAARCRAELGARYSTDDLEVIARLETVQDVCSLGIPCVQPSVASSLAEDRTQYFDACSGKR